MINRSARSRMFWPNFRNRARTKNPASKEYFSASCVLLIGTANPNSSSAVAEQSKHELQPLELISLRRVIANALIAVLCAGSAAPLVLFAQLTMVPACCRRDGKHRCMMAMSGTSSLPDSGATLHNATPDCPYRSHPSQLTGAQGAPRIPLTSIWLISAGSLETYHYARRHSHSITLRPPRGPPADLQFT